MSLGQTLRTAREAKGITTAEMASTTHMLIQIVEGLEAEDFRRIPAAIYGRGFIKLYCEVVGLDPKPLQAEFMALYSNGGGSKGMPTRAERREVAPPPPPPPPPPPEPEPKLEPPAPPPPPVTPIVPEPAKEPIISTEPPPKAVADLFSLNQQETAAQSAPAPMHEPVPEPPAQEPPAPEPEPPAPEKTEKVAPRRSYGELFEQTYAEDEPVRPSAAEKFHDTISNVSHGVFANVKKLPPNTGRMLVVGVAGIVLIVLIVWGVMALYKATTPQQPTEKPGAQTAAPASPTKAEPKSSPDKKPDAQSKKADTAEKKAAEKKAPEKKTAPKQTQKAADKKVAQPKSAGLKVSGVKVPPLYID